MRRLVFLSLCLFACGSGRNGFDGPGGPTGAGPTGTGPAGGFDGGGADASKNDDGCSEDSKQVYVVTNDDQLLRFQPATKTITPVGSLDCPAGGEHPFSMAVDRNGTAWILYSDGRIFKASTKDASCTATTYEPGQRGIRLFGMAFVSDGANDETLYVADHGTDGLAKIDTQTLKLTFIGSYEGFASPGELTGTGNQRLFAFFTKGTTITWPRIVELDRASGKIMNQKGLFGTEIGDGWAFAHWGGDFWLFTAPQGSSEITRYDYNAEATDTIVSDLGYVIVGAGVSTCAPLTRPN